MPWPRVSALAGIRNNRAFFKRGTDPWASSTVSALDKVFKQYKDNKELVVVIKIDREARFNNMVDVIDELDLANLTRFSLGTLTPEEKQEVESL